MDNNFVTQLYDDSTLSDQLVWNVYRSNSDILQQVMDNRGNATKQLHIEKIGWFLGRFTTTEVGRSIACTSQIADFICQMLSSDLSTPRSVQHLGLAIGNIAANNPEGKRLFCTPETASAIINTFNNYATTPEIVRYLGCAIHYITVKNPEGQRHFSTPEAVSAIIAALSEYAATPYSAQYLGYLIRNITTNNPEGQRLFSTPEAVSAIINALAKHATKSDSDLSLVVAVNNIVADSSAGKRLFSTPETVTAFLGCCEKFPSTKGPSTIICRVIGHICWDNQEGQKVFTTPEIAAAICHVLVNLVEDDNILENVCRAIAFISIDNPDGQKFFSSSTVAQGFLKHIEKFATTPSCVRFVCKAISSVAKNNEVGMKLLATPEFIDAIKKMEKYATDDESKKEYELCMNLSSSQSKILAKLQAPAASDMIRESMKHFCIADTVSHDQLCSIQASVAPHIEHLAPNPLAHVLTNSIQQQSAKILALRAELAKFQSELSWLASAFPKVAELSVLNSRLLIINNFNATSICELKKEIDHAKKLISVVLDANTRSLIDNNAFKDCVNNQNPQEINSLSQCWLAIRAAELEKTMFEELNLAADKHFFGMLKSAQLEFFDRLQIEAAAVKLDSFNRSCIAAFVVHHDRSRQEITHQEEEQHFVLTHDCVFDNTVIEERFACRIMLSHALDSSFSSSVREKTSAHRVIMHEFELAQQRVQVEIDERITRERSILEEERTVRQFVEDTHHVGLDILMREAIEKLDEHFKEFTIINNELDKFNWFRLACHQLNLKFPGEFSKDKIIQILEAELLQKEEFLEVTDQTLKTCGFPGAIINKLRKVIDHLSSASSFSSPAVQQLLHEVKSRLPGVFVIPPAEAGLTKNRDNKLGAGGYGDVYKATIVSQRNRRCAAKIFYDKDIAIQEAKNLFHLHHPNVVQLIAVTVEDTPRPSVVLLFELADCDLMHLFIKKNLPLHNVRDFVKQIACGLEYLHQTDRANGKPGIVHLDIKPENILVFRIGTSITLKISDLGFVHEMETSSTGHRTTFAATERYLSPETRVDRHKCRKNSKHDVRIFPAIDIFAFGIILLQMIAPIWYIRHGRGQMQVKIDDVIHNEALLQSNECCIDDFASEVGDCDDLVKLVKDCLMINRKIRPQNGAALLLRLTSPASANGDDFDVVNENNESRSPSDDDERVRHESGNDGGDSSTSNHVRNTRSQCKGDGFSSTNSSNMPQTGRRYGRLGSAHQTLDGEDDE